MSDKKPQAMDLMPYVDMLGGSREFLRMWASEGGPVTCFINPVPVGPDPIAFGVALVDCVRHGAKTYARAVDISEAEALERIFEGFDLERANPSDVATELPQKGSMN